MQFAAFVSMGVDGKPYMGIQVMDGDVIFQLALAQDHNADEIIKNVYDGLKEARADLHRQASGLALPIKGLEVPNGFRSPQGRPVRRKSGTG